MRPKHLRPGGMEDEQTAAQESEPLCYRRSRMSGTESCRRVRPQDRWSMSARCRHSRHHTTSSTFAAAALPSNIAGPLVGVLHRPDVICTKHRIRWGCVSA
jgi:hypothetical protein